MGTAEPSPKRSHQWLPAPGPSCSAPSFEPIKYRRVAPCQLGSTGVRLWLASARLMRALLALGATALATLGGAAGLPSCQSASRPQRHSQHTSLAAVKPPAVAHRQDSTNAARWPCAAFHRAVTRSIVYKATYLLTPRALASVGPARKSSVWVCRTSALQRENVRTAPCTSEQFRYWLPSSAQSLASGLCVQAAALNRGRSCGAKLGRNPPA